MEPLLSVIIPAYNVEDYILPAIQSALSQTFRNLEVIVVDDGSTDSTPNRLASLCDGRLRVIRQDNAGLAAARNTGIRASRGKYIGFLDGDDVWLRKKAGTHLAILERDPSVGITFSYSAYIDEKGNPTGQLLITKITEPSLQNLVVRNHITPSSALVRKDCFLQAGLFDERLRACEDYEMWVRILNKTRYKARLVPQVLNGYRIRATSLTMSFGYWLHYAEQVMDIFEASVPTFTPKLRRRAMAETYRIASRKALSSGQVGEAKALMREAVRRCPTIILGDLRALGTQALVILQSCLPSRLRNVPYRWVRWAMKIFYRFYIGRPNVSDFGVSG